MEFTEVMLTYRSRKVRFVTIYRPKPGKNNRYTMTNFYKEFATLMSHYNLTKENLIVCAICTYVQHEWDCPYLSLKCLKCCFP